MSKDTGETQGRRLETEEAFEHETFSELDFQGRELHGKDFYRCTFRASQLQESQWRRCKLEDCVFTGCDLTRVQWQQVALRGVRFEDSKLMGIDWTNVSANPEMTFDGCVLRYASFVGHSLRKTAFVKCSAQEANFFDLDLTEADFSETNLTGSNFRGCTLTRTDFSRAVGAFLDPALNRLKDTHVPVESAVLLAQHLGMRVSGFSAQAPERPTRRKR